MSLIFYFDFFMERLNADKVISDRISHWMSLSTWCNSKGIHIVVVVVVVVGKAYEGTNTELSRRAFEGQHERINLTFIWKLDRRIDKWWFLFFLRTRFLLVAPFAVATTAAAAAVAAIVLNFKPLWMNERMNWIEQFTDRIV